MKLLLIIMISLLVMTNISYAENQNSFITSSQSLGQMNQDDILNFTIIMKLQNADKLDQYIKDVNNPYSSNYHKFLTISDLQNNFYPKQSDIEIIKNSLKNNGFDMLAISGLSIEVSANIKSINNFFNTTLNRYKKGNKTYFGSLDSIEVPPSLFNLIEGTVGLDNFTEIRPFLENVTPNDALGQAPFTSSDVRGAYSYNPLYNSGINGNGVRVAIVDMYGDPTIASDLAAFSSKYGLPQATLNIYYPQGQPSITCPPSADQVVCNWATETAMDVEWVHSIAPYAIIDLVIDQDLINGVNFVINNNFDSIMSLSWGFSENPQFLSYERSTDSYFQLAAAEGISVFVSSGDNGAYGDGSNLVNEYPSTSPYVTSVGGTRLYLNWIDNSYNHEEAWSGSGGGRSITFTKPYWQYGNNVPSDGARDVPDIAIDADPSSGVHIIVNGVDLSIPILGGGGGTSLSAPLWAGTTALVNQKINGRIGLLNPLLYQLARSGSYSNDFNDITSGNNDYYNAGSYYDQVTGWGTPKANNFVNDIASLYFQTNTIITFSNFIETPNSPTMYSQQIYTFYTTISDNLGTINNVLFYLNGVQYTTTQSGNVYSASLNTLPAGTYNFYWYASDNHGVSSQSQSMTYTVNKASPSITISIPTNFIYNGSSASTNLTINTVNNQLPVSFYLNYTNLADSSSTLTNLGSYYTTTFVSNASAGIYCYSATTSGNQNYNFYSTSQCYQIYRQTPTGNILPNNNLSYGFTNYTLNISSISNQIAWDWYIDNFSTSFITASNPVWANLSLSAGIHTMLLNTSGNQNYTSFSLVKAYQINKTNPFLVLQIPSSFTYNGNLVQANATISSLFNQLNASFYVNSILIGNNTTNYTDSEATASIYNYILNNSENQNYTSQKLSGILYIAQVTPQLTLMLNYQFNNISLLYGQNLEINATINANQALSNFTLLLNNIPQSTVNSTHPGSMHFLTSVQLKPGFYIATASYSGSQNYTSNNISSNVTVQPMLSIYNPKNTTYIVGNNTTANLTAHGIYDSYNLTYYINGNQSDYFVIENNTPESMDIGLLNLGYYNLTYLIFNGTLNDTYEVDFTIAPPETIPPTIENAYLIPAISKPDSNVTFFVKANDTSGVDYVNITVYNESWYQVYGPKNLMNLGDNWFTDINTYGFPEGLYYVNLTASDVLGNNETIWISNFTVNQSSESVNSFVENPISTNNSQFVMNATNMTLQIVANQSLSNESIGISEYDTNPTIVQLSIPSLGKYYQIESSAGIKNNLLWALINVSYNSTYVSNAGIDPSTLRIYYYNSTSNSWIPFNSSFGGVDTISNYVWANTTHFSYYGIFGSLAPYCGDSVCNNGESCSSCPSDCGRCPAQNQGGGVVSSGGTTPICTENWTCTDWSTCILNKQTRLCTDKNKCGTNKTKPIESQSCTLSPACTENWTCTDWSACVNDTQTRACTDKNNCGTASSKPVESQSCTLEKAPSAVATTPTGFFLGLSTNEWVIAIVAGVVIVLIIIFIFLKGRRKNINP